MIAISYRREDSLPVAGRLYDRLQNEFGRGNVFMDFDSIPYGVDFRDHIKQMIDQSKVLVAMIGPDWAGKRRHQGRRIDDPADFVRLEIGYALNRKLPIIPVLVNNAQMPGPEQLPKDIEGLAFRNAITLDSGIDFHHHAERLATAINRLLTETPPTPLKVEKAQPAEPPTPLHVPLVPPESRLEAVQPPPPAAIEKSFGPELSRTSPIQKKHEQPLERSAAVSATPSPIAVGRQRPPRVVSWRSKIDALRAGLRRVGQNVQGTFSASKSRITRSLGLLRDLISRRFRASIDHVQHHRKAIGWSVVCLVALTIGTGAIYWGIRSGTFQVLLVQSIEFFKSKSRSAEPVPPLIGTVPRPNEYALTTPAPTVLPTSQQTKGALAVDSVPQGEVFEIIDAERKHHIGKTPVGIEDLPVGYAQIIFKREGFSDHSEMIWVAANMRSSITWTFPDNTRVKKAHEQDSRKSFAYTSPTAEPSQPIPPPTPATTPHPWAQNGRPWQVWISDFVRQFADANESPDPNPTLTCYAPTVSYFDEKNKKDQAYIRQDIETSNMRWPIRHSEIEGDIHLQEKVPGQQCLASYKLNSYLESPQLNSWMKQQLAIDLEITLMDGVPKITAIRGKKLHQQKGIPGKSPPPQVTNTGQKSNPYGISVPGKPGFAKSPYAPSKGEIDLRRFRKGTEVKCPFTGKTFIVP